MIVPLVKFIELTPKMDKVQCVKNPTRTLIILPKMSTTNWLVFSSLLFGWNYILYLNTFNRLTNSQSISSRIHTKRINGFAKAVYFGRLLLACFNRSLPHSHVFYTLIWIYPYIYIDMFVFDRWQWRRKNVRFIQIA